MKKIGFFTSFGLGGADHTSYVLSKSLSKHYGIEHFIVFYNNWCFPDPKKSIKNQIKPCRYEHYLNFITPIEIKNVEEFNNYDLDVLITHRGGSELWLLPDFEKTNFNFKIIEINFHGELRTKADLRIFPSQTMVNFKNLHKTNHVVIPNPIAVQINENNMREKYNLQNKFVIGRVARGDNDIYCKINLEAYKNIEDNNTFFMYVNPSPNALRDAKTLKIKNILFIKPTVDNDTLNKIYNTFDVHAHSNCIGETFGNSVAESMIRGIPTISHKGFASWPQAHKEFFINTPELYIENNNCSNLTHNYSIILNKLKNNSEYRSKVSNIQKEYALTHFSKDIVIKKYIQVIDNL